MKTEAKIHLNKHAPEWKPSGVFGRQLEAGDVLQEGDVYDSTNGSWELCPVPGLKLGEGFAATWVRPE